MEKIAMNVKEMAKHLGVSAYTAYQLTKRPGFPTLKIGKRIAIPVEQFMEWIARHCNFTQLVSKKDWWGKTLETPELSRF